MPQEPNLRPPFDQDATASRWTSVAPVVCAVHCALTPFVVVALPVAGAAERGIEWTLLGVTILLIAFVLGSRLGKRETLLPAALVGAGVAVWAASLMQAFQPVPEDVSTPVAAMTVALGLVWNARRHKAGEEPECECSSCASVTHQMEPAATADAA